MKTESSQTNDGGVTYCAISSNFRKTNTEVTYLHKLCQMSEEAFRLSRGAEILKFRQRLNQITRAGWWTGISVYRGWLRNVGEAFETRVRKGTAAPKQSKPWNRSCEIAANLAWKAKREWKRRWKVLDTLQFRNWRR